MIKLEDVDDLELRNEDSFVFVDGGWHIVEDRPLTEEEAVYLQDNYRCEIHALACEILR